jgi:hypothetical protein
MTLTMAGGIAAGSRILYDDGRLGHQGVAAAVLAVDADGMTVQFEDRADTNCIRFSDSTWMDFIKVEGRQART